jgi:hypothetical protein
MSACLSLLRGNSVFDIAGVRFSLQVSPLLPEPFHLPIHFEPFAAVPDSPFDVGVVLEPVNAKARAAGALVYESQLNWRVLALEGTYRYDWYHPLSSAILIRGEWTGESNRVEIGFDLGEWRRMEETYWRNVESPRLTLLPPFEQLPFLAPLVRREVILVHACGAVIDGRAFVFAGHSGDGKTTLSRLLSAEGFDLLSDERVAIRRQGSSFTAYGTPWPGEGNVVHAKGFPLAGVFLLSKGPEHRVRDGKPAFLASELLARTIVPYYLPSETDIILTLLQGLTLAVPLRELSFAKRGGLARVLLERE